MYNTGRMWRLRNDPATKTDGDIAKAMRNAFIARHCSCTWVTLPDDADISGLEAKVIALVPSEMMAWNRRGMHVYDGPAELVDALLKELRLSPVERAAIARQQVRQMAGESAAQAPHDTAPVLDDVRVAYPRHPQFTSIASAVLPVQRKRPRGCEVYVFVIMYLIWLRE